jgi:surface carbohydrate biosynthesis protein (TIGR04326 family)
LKSPKIYDVIKFFILEDILLLFKNFKIIYNNKTTNFKEIMNSVIANENYYKANKYKKIASSILYFFLFIKDNYTFIKNKKKNSEITFFDYFANLDLKNNKFQSNYWTTLIDLLEINKIQTNWEHFYVESNQFSTIKNANTTNIKLNNTYENHLLIENYLSFQLIFNILIDYCKIVYKALKIKNINNLFTNDNNINYSEMYLEEWYNNFYGRKLMLNCIYHNLYRKSLKDLPFQKIGFYLFENQFWEIIVNFYWRKYKHGELYGVIHTPIRFWDFRYFYDLRYFKGIQFKNYFPNKIIINGELQKSLLFHSNIPDNFIYNAEALRYLHLLNKNTTHKYSNINGVIKILLCLDYMQTENDFIFSILNKATLILKSKLFFIIKPHPANKFNMFKEFNYNYIIDESYISNLLPISDIVICSNTSSCAIESYVHNIPTIQIINQNKFDFSPTYTLKGRNLIRNYQQLVLFIENYINDYTKIQKTDRCNIFHLDNDIPKWKKLLSHSLSKKID